MVAILPVLSINNTKSFGQLSLTKIKYQRRRLFTSSHRYQLIVLPDQQRRETSLDDVVVEWGTPSHRQHPLKTEGWAGVVTASVPAPGVSRFDRQEPRCHPCHHTTTPQLENDMPNRTLSMIAEWSGTPSYSQMKCNCSKERELDGNADIDAEPRKPTTCPLAASCLPRGIGTYGPSRDTGQWLVHRIRYVFVVKTPKGVGLREVSGHRCIGEER